MCGIIGIYNNNLPEIKIKKIAETLNHRGPDDEGYYFDKENKIAFAHKRLSIIDLQTGHQPISNEDETIWIIFNGEIYNYKILKNELIIKGHKFKTKSDTEVIIHCYEEYGENFVEKLNGIFAFALWDKRLKKIIVARDKVGVKPLYYYSDNNIIIFASEIKAILKHPSIKIEPDYESIDKYLTFLYIPDEKTFFKNIKKLMPGFLLLIKEGQITIKQYWDLQISKNEKENDKKFIYENFLELFEEVVKDQMMSDVPIGSFLSGGIDTSCICSLLSKNMSERLKTFTVSYSKNLSYDEYFYAKIIGEKINADMYRIEQNPYEFRESLSEIIFKLDQPSTGAALVPLYFVSKLAKENNVKVVFS
ncbi:MAG TPA: asparagine synthase (glutamine-hydrolyzing), partial [bacterium]|nr:asparagine synthase (glutamine-hydrolyzing) [bacterium]